MKIAEVNDALALLMLLLDTAYDQQVSVEQVRCLFGPLHMKLGEALESLR